MHNIPREKYFDMFLKVKKILTVFLKFLSNWLRLIMLCENFTVFWGSSLDCKVEQTILFKHYTTGLARFTTISKVNFRS